MEKKNDDKDKKKPVIRFQKDVLFDIEEGYEPKLKIDSDLDSVLKVMVTNPSPSLVKRAGNKPVKKKKK